MPLFFHKKSNRLLAGKQNRFRESYFQSRIRNVRNNHRSPHYTSRADYSLPGLRHWKLYVLLIVVLLIFGVAVYCVAISDFFLVREATVKGNQKVTAEAINGWLSDAGKIRDWGIVPGNDWVFLNKTRVEKILTAHTTQILGVTEIKKTWPNKIEITVEERAPVAIWQGAGDYYYLGRDAVAFEQVPIDYATSTNTYLRIVDLSDQRVSVGDNLGVVKALSFLKDVVPQWSKKIQTEIAEFKLPGRASQDIFVTTAAGWTAYFDLGRDNLKQLDDLQLLLQKEVPADRQAKLAYIDLRLPNLAYYCYKDEPCASIKTGENANSGAGNEATTKGK